MTDTLDDAILEALANERRRRVCEVLAAADRGILSLDTLADRVAARESDRSTSPDPTQVRTVAIKLHHIHLPKLDEAGLLSFDHTVGDVYYEDDPVVESVGRGEHPIDAMQSKSDAE